ncbi:MAG TPA: cardiolipin synthase ClsB [Thiobacillaceae bacterium]|nr:cardiolipin synthase ClsB [Thiobacillaceae bacterium]HNU64265.1 cardiolipin synthase ClsB [Thiobacillaceae bacterium]
MIRPGNRLTLLQDGAAYFPALMTAIDQAQHQVHLESYIFRADGVGRAVAHCLMEAARRGVATRLLLDGFGARSLPRDLARELRNAGVDLLIFRPDRWQLRMPLRHHRHRLRRMHRKLALVDARVAFVGGINIIDDLDEGRLTHPRRDYAVRIEGPVVADVYASARRLWRLVKWSHFGLRRGEYAGLKPVLDAVGDQQARFVARDNLRDRRAIEAAYLRAIRAARQEIVLANAYFLPGFRFRHALVEAARRGVRVVLILQGYTDHPLYRAAGQALYRYFLENKVEIYEYGISELHAKVAVVDGVWATVGSSNLDPFSMLLAREANVVVYDRAFAQELRHSLESLLCQDGQCLQRLNWEHIPWHERLGAWLAYGVVRGAMGLAGFAQGWDREAG